MKIYGYFFLIRAVANVLNKIQYYPIFHDRVIVRYCEMMILGPTGVASRVSRVLRGFSRVEKEGS